MNLRGSTVGASRILLLLLCAGWTHATTLGAQTAVPPAAPAGESLRFAPGVVRELSALYVHYAPDEYVACLKVDSAGVVTGFDIPYFENVTLAGPAGLRQRALRNVEGCEHYGSRVTLHSHPASGRDSFCFLPAQDVREFDLRSEETHIAIICSLGVLWWTRADVQRGEPAYVVPGQFAAFAR